MNITICSTTRARYDIRIECMTLDEFDKIRTLLQGMVKDDERFSGVKESHLDLKSVHSLMSGMESC